MPEFIRKKVLFSKKLQDATVEQKKLKDQMDAVLNVLLDVVDADVDLYLTIPNFVAVKIGAHAPYLTAFLRAYMGYFVKYP